MNKEQKFHLALIILGGIPFYAGIIFDDMKLNYRLYMTGFVLIVQLFFIGLNYDFHK